MECRAKRFLVWWSLIFLGLALLVSAFDIAVDPYLVFDIPKVRGFNAHKGAAANLVYPYKAYEVERIGPRTVLLGSSRVESVDARSTSWPKEYYPVYNLSLPGAGPYVWFRYLQHLMAAHVPETVVVGLDFEYFLDGWESRHSTFATHKFESRLSVNSDGTLNTGAGRQRILDLLQFSLSYEAVFDSVSTVIGNVRGEEMDTILGNVLDEERGEEALAETGTFPWMQFTNVVNVRRLAGARNRFAMGDLQDLLDLCKSHGTRVILYIHPMPADMLEMMDLMGYWVMFEDWKRELLRVVSAYQKQDGRVALWDFSDYDAYSTDTAQQQDGRILPWFWESFHYRKALADLIVGRIVGRSELPFGDLLIPDGLEDHLAQIRQRRQEYRTNHAADVARMKAVHDAALRVLRSPFMAARYALPVPSEE